MGNSFHFLEEDKNDIDSKTFIKTEEILNIKQEPLFDYSDFEMSSKLNQFTCESSEKIECAPAVKLESTSSVKLESTSSIKLEGFSDKDSHLSDSSLSEDE